MSKLSQFNAKMLFKILREYQKIIYKCVTVSFEVVLSFKNFEGVKIFGPTALASRYFKSETVKVRVRSEEGV